MLNRCLEPVEPQTAALRRILDLSRRIKGNDHEANPDRIEYVARGVCVGSRHCPLGQTGEYLC